MFDNFEEVCVYLFVFIEVDLVDIEVGIVFGNILRFYEFYEEVEIIYVVVLDIFGMLEWLNWLLFYFCGIICEW